MHVLRRFREAVVPGGVVLDLQVIRPHPRVETEGRLLYVAVTRAETRLTLMVPWRLYSFRPTDQASPDATGQRSQFIPDGIVGMFNCVGIAPGDDEGDGGARDRNESRVIDLTARVRAGWAAMGR